MKVGDLVKIAGTGIVALITEIETVPSFYGSHLAPIVWVSLHDHPVPLKASKLEVINENR